MLVRVTLVVVVDVAFFVAVMLVRVALVIIMLVFVGMVLVRVALVVVVDVAFFVAVMLVSVALMRVVPAHRVSFRTDRFSVST
jgi:hypothetical protein